MVGSYPLLHLKFTKWYIAIGHIFCYTYGYILKKAVIQGQPHGMICSWLSVCPGEVEPLKTIPEHSWTSDKPQKSHSKSNLGCFSTNTCMNC